MAAMDKALWRSVLRQGPRTRGYRPEWFGAPCGNGTLSLWSVACGARHERRLETARAADKIFCLPYRVDDQQSAFPHAEGNSSTSKTTTPCRSRLMPMRG